MKELLKRWAELEPERCRYNADGSHYNDAPHFWLTMDDQDGTCDSIDVLDIDWDMPGSIGIVQSYVQSVIIDRGWTARIRILDVVDWDYAAEVIVRYNDSPDTQSYKSGSDNSPAEALLTAYIQALESIQS